MKTSINLALGTNVVKKKSYVVYVYWLFGLVLVAALVVIAANIALKIQYSGLESQESSLITSINSQPEKKVNMLLLAERSNNIRTVFSKRGDMDKRLIELVSIFPQSVSLTGIAATDNEFTLSLTATNLAAMNTVLEEDLPKHLRESNSSIQFVKISSFIAQEGAYLLTLNFQYPGGALNE